MHSEKRTANPNEHDLLTSARWSWTQAKGVRVRVVTTSVMGVVRVALMLSGVWISKVLIDAAVAHAPTARLWQLAVLLVMLLLSGLALSLAVNHLSTQTEIRMRHSLRSRLFALLMDSSDNRRHSGELSNTLMTDTTQVSEAVCVRVPQLTVMISQLAGAFAMLAMLAPWLAIAAAAVMPVSLLISHAYAEKMRRLTTDVRHDEADIQTCVQESCQHRAVVQSLGREKEISDRLDTLQKSCYTHVMNRKSVSNHSRAIVQLGFIGGYLLVFIWCIFGLSHGTITFGLMAAFLQLVAKVQAPVSNISGALSPIAHAAASADRLMTIFEDTCSEIDDFADRRPLPSGPIGLRFSDVCFRYPGGSRVLDHFTFDFPPSSKTAITGPTGIGKTTMARLILALIRPQSGCINVYGADGEVSVTSLTRRLMSYVPQGNSLLCGTIRDNLLLGNPEATEEHIRHALHTAVAEFAYELPQGIDTKVGELGAMLSAGQAQRIAIARALLRQAEVLILDEFNSALDQSTATTLMERLTEELPSTTIIFISHRPEVDAYCHQKYCFPTKP